MACRVGMTTNPEERRQYWQRRYPYTFRNWVVLARNLTYDVAASTEDAVARRDGCAAEPGGPRIPGNVWSVYRFEHS